jgi:hypothetical protein
MSFRSPTENVIALTPGSHPGQALPLRNGRGYLSDLGSTKTTLARLRERAKGEGPDAICFDEI